MAVPRHFTPADLGYEPDVSGSFCLATVNWSGPKEWDEDGRPPLGAAERDDALYVILRNHWRQARRNTIVYVGMTTRLPTRFNQHRCADEMRAKRGSTMLSVGTVNYSGCHTHWARNNPGKALRQLEHILIWALWPTLLKEKNQYSIPLLAGKNVAEAKPWIIRRTGHRFNGRMSREIVYPWMIIKAGRDRSLND